MCGKVGEREGEREWREGERDGWRGREGGREREGEGCAWVMGCRPPHTFRFYVGGVFEVGDRIAIEFEDASSPALDESALFVHPTLAESARAEGGRERERERGRERENERVPMIMCR